MCKQITNGFPWFLFRDFNVARHVSEHTAGGSSISTDMHEFYDCINQIKVEDLRSSSLFYTCKKSLHKVKQVIHSGVLKKLDISIACTILGKYSDHKKLEDRLLNIRDHSAVFFFFSLNSLYYDITNNIIHVSNYIKHMHHTISGSKLYSP